MTTYAVVSRDTDDYTFPWYRGLTDFGAACDIARRKSTPGEFTFEVWCIEGAGLDGQRVAVYRRGQYVEAETL